MGIKVIREAMLDVLRSARKSDEIFTTFDRMIRKSEREYQREKQARRKVNVEGKF